MKKLIIISFMTIVCLGLHQRIQAQQLDTLNYLKSVEQQQAHFINQPFSVLLNAMTQIQPKSAWGGRNLKNKNISIYTSFFFDPPKSTFYKGVIQMIIYWKNPILSSEISSYENLNNFNFTSAEKQFYGTKIIKEIKVYRL